MFRNKANRRWRLKAFLAVVALYLGWLGWQVGVYKRYTTEKSPPPPFSKPQRAFPEERNAAQPPVLYEVRGAYHMHSKFSDGRKTVDEIARAAARVGLDFIILTDHGAPNRASLDAQGRRDGVLVLAGTEISTSRGHLVALAFEPPSGRFSQNADNAVYEVHSLGGFTVIAHPYSKTRWSWGGRGSVDGLEIMDSDSMLKRNWPQALIRLPLLLVKPEVVLLEIITRPEESLRKWDQLLAGGAVRGFFSADAHFLYGPVFKIFRLIVLLDAPPSGEFEAARREIFEALRAGRFFSAVDAAADPSGFRFWAENERLRVLSPFSFAHETRIIHDGKAVGISSSGELAYDAPAPGAYRAEVYLRERSPLGGDVPWIVSNAVVLRSGGKENR